MRGPAKKPAEIALKQGNPGKAKRAALQQAASPNPDPETVVRIAAPAHLDDDERKIWDERTSSAVGQAMIKSGDLHALERLCVYLNRWRLMNAAVKDKRTKNGVRLTEKHERERYGTVTKLRWEVKYATELEGMIRALEIQFGATPSSRVSLLTRSAEFRDPDRPPQPGAPGSMPSEPASPGTPPAPHSPIGVLGARPRTH